MGPNLRKKAYRTLINDKFKIYEPPERVFNNKQ